MSLLPVGCCTAFLMRFLLFALAGSIRPTFLSRNEPMIISSFGWQYNSSTMSGLPSLDPFNDIDPMLVEESNLPAVNSSGLSMASKYVSDYGIEEESDEEEWVEENEDDENRNFFDVFDDEDNDL